MRLTFTQKQFKNYPVFVNAPPVDIPDDDDGGRLEMDARRSGDAYIDRVIEELEFIDKPGVGRVVLEALPKDKALLITRGSNKSTLGFTEASDQKRALAPGARIGDGLIEGIGGGSSTRILFDPGGSDVLSCMSKNADSPCVGTEPPYILVHEMVHAMRQMEGKWNPGIIVHFPAKEQAYDNAEEFYAILVANIYMSQQGETQFVRDHAAASRPLRPEWSTSKGFLSDGLNAGVVKKFCDMEEPDFARKIGLLAAAFNPIAAYLRCQGK
jgi:hypothetical protein